ncbi:tetratricopeptide repeat protein, partial [Pirellulaceae bacterium]|nr:tetratricopeptide repeat protein [Pirellulaceae bacterium]
MSRFLCLVVGLALIGCSQQKYEGTNNKAGDELNKGMAFFDKQDFEKAIPHFTEAIKLDPKLAIAFSNRGGAYLSI